MRFQLWEPGAGRDARHCAGQLDLDRRHRRRRRRADGLTLALSQAGHKTEPLQLKGLSVIEPL